MYGMTKYHPEILHIYGGAEKINLKKFVALNDVYASDIFQALMRQNKVIRL